MNIRTKYKRGDDRLLFYISVKVEQDLNPSKCKSHPVAAPEKTAVFVAKTAVFLTFLEKFCLCALFDQRLPLFHFHFSI